MTVSISIVILIKSTWKHGFLSLFLSLTLSLSIRPYHPSLPAGVPNFILCPCRGVVGKFLLVYNHWHDHVKGFIEKRYLWVSPCFYQQFSTRLVRLTWMVFEMGGNTHAHILLRIGRQIYTNIYIHTYTHIKKMHLRTHIRSRTHTCNHTCLFTPTRRQKHTFVYFCTRAYKHTLI